MVLFWIESGSKQRKVQETVENQKFRRETSFWTGRIVAKMVKNNKFQRANGFERESKKSVGSERENSNLRENSKRREFKLVKPLKRTASCTLCSRGKRAGNAANGNQ